MTPEQINQLLSVLEKIAQHSPDSQPVFALLGVIIAIMSLMWRDLRGSLKENRTEWQAALTSHKEENVRELADHKADIKKELADHKADNEKDFDLLWEDRRRCQLECCPPRVKKE